MIMICHCGALLFFTHGQNQISSSEIFSFLCVVLFAYRVILYSLKGATVALIDVCTFLLRLR